MKVRLSIWLQIAGWFIYWLSLVIINLVYYKSESLSKPILLIWTILFTLSGISIFFLLTRLYRYLIRINAGIVRVLTLVIILSFCAAYLWGLFEPLISWLINPEISKLSIAWDINSRGTFALTFIVAFFSVLYYFTSILEKSKSQVFTPEIRSEIISCLDGTISVFSKNDIVLLSIKHIKKISVEGNYSRIVDSRNNKYELKQSLKSWEAKLPKNCFLRIHRSTIINRNYIEKIEPWHNYTFRIRLNNSDFPEEVSRRYAMLIRKELNL